jgi:hypothetical protein
MLLYKKKLGQDLTLQHAYLAIKFTSVSQMEQALVNRSCDVFYNTFDYTLKPFKLKASMCLIDVGSGSDTRLMVK